VLPLAELISLLLKSPVTCCRNWGLEESARHEVSNHVRVRDAMHPVTQKDEAFRWKIVFANALKPL
jgi:hypothetical protein